MQVEEKAADEEGTQEKGADPIEEPAIKAPEEIIAEKAEEAAEEDPESSYTAPPTDKAKPVAQPELQLDGAPKGKFEGQGPNIHDGEDLDIPPFLRKKPSIQKN